MKSEVIDHGNVFKVSGRRAIPITRKSKLTSQTQFVKLPTYTAEGRSTRSSLCVVFKSGSLNVDG